MPFILGTPTLAVNTNSQTEVKIESKVMDERAKILTAYLAQYNSPLQYQAQNFIDAADQNNLDWKLVAAISGVESTFGKAIPGGYNAWGWGVYGNQAIYFKSWKEGIYTVSQGLREGYLNKGLNDPYAINRVYAASPTWGTHVNFFLEDIEQFKNEREIFAKNQLASTLTLKIAGPSAMISLR